MLGFGAAAPVVAAALIFMGSVTEARSGRLSDWEGHYSASTLGTDRSCQLCHGSSTSVRNRYGTDIENELMLIIARDGGRIGTGSAAQNIEAFTIVESADSNGDSFTNIDEINANMHPGDATDFPVPSGGTAPLVTITTPPDGASYVRGDVVFADYACTCDRKRTSTETSEVCVTIARAYPSTNPAQGFAATNPPPKPQSPSTTRQASPERAA
jgi:hypothetical protein